MIRQLASQQGQEQFIRYGLGLQDGTLIPHPQQFQKAKVLDIYYKFDHKRNQTVLVALMEDGAIASYQIEKIYQLQEREKKEQTKQKSAIDQSGKHENLSKVQVVGSIINKIMEESNRNANFFDNLSEGGSIHSILTRDEITILNEMIEWFEIYVEMFITCLFLFVLFFIFCFRRASSFNRQNEQVRRVQQ